MVADDTLMQTKCRSSLRTQYGSNVDSGCIRINWSAGLRSADRTFRTSAVELIVFHCLVINVFIYFREWDLTFRFLPCDAMRCTVFVIVIRSVCLSVTLVDCVHMVRPTIMISPPYGRPIILVSRDIKLIPKFEGDYPERRR